MSAEKEFCILNHKPEELQTRNGCEVLNVYTHNNPICILTVCCIIRNHDGLVTHTTTDKNGCSRNGENLPYDVILKPKKKVIKAPFYYMGSKISLCGIVETKEQATKWCNDNGFILVKWLGDTPLALECDEE